MEITEKSVCKAEAYIFDAASRVYFRPARCILTSMARSRARILTVTPASILSSASVFSSSDSSPSRIPLMYVPKTLSSVFNACNFWLNQASKEFTATAMFSAFANSPALIYARSTRDREKGKGGEREKYTPRGHARDDAF